MRHTLSDSGRAIDETKVITAGSPAKSVQSEDVVIAMDENLPLIHKDTVITITAHSNVVLEAFNTYCLHLRPTRIFSFAVFPPSLI